MEDWRFTSRVRENVRTGSEDEVTSLLRGQCPTTGLCSVGMVGHNGWAERMHVQSIDAGGDVRGVGLRPTRANIGKDLD
jgi:hypothetical protein